MDPIGIAGGLNVYGFAGGDPINFSDPFGLCPESMGGDGKSKGLSDCPEGSEGYRLHSERMASAGASDATRAEARSTEPTFLSCMAPLAADMRIGALESGARTSALYGAAGFVVGAQISGVAGRAVAVAAGLSPPVKFVVTAAAVSAGGVAGGTAGFVAGATVGAYAGALVGAGSAVVARTTSCATRQLQPPVQSSPE